jgi:hypothetical protein
VLRWLFGFLRDAITEARNATRSSTSTGRPGGGRPQPGPAAAAGDAWTTRPTGLGSSGRRFEDFRDSRPDLFDPAAAEPRSSGHQSGTGEPDGEPQSTVDEPEVLDDGEAWDADGGEAA